jgi:hypothetical protein
MTYFFQGVAIGKGSVGIKSLILRLRGMPIGSAVLFYPEYVTPTASGMGWSPPYADYFAEIMQTLRDNHMLIISSERDRFGTLMVWK